MGCSAWWTRVRGTATAVCARVWWRCWNFATGVIGLICAWPVWNVWFGLPATPPPASPVTYGKTLTTQLPENFAESQAREPHLFLPALEHLFRRDTCSGCGAYTVTLHVVGHDPRPKPGYPRGMFAYELCSACLERAAIEVMNRDQLAVSRHPDLDPIPAGWSWDDGGPYA